MEPVIDHTELVGPSGSSRARGQVGDFHRAYGLPIRTAPTAAIGPDQVALRQALIEEEVRELADAARLGDVVGVADALADIVYVATAPRTCTASTWTPSWTRCIPPT